MGQQFVPTETFKADVNGHTNRYLAGHQYTVYDSPDHRDLAKKVMQWAEQGRVVITGVTAGAVRPPHIHLSDGGD